MLIVVSDYLELVDEGCSCKGIDDSPTVCNTADEGCLVIVFDSTRSSAVLYELPSSDIGGSRRVGTPLI